VDPIGASVTLALAASAFFRTISGKREALTAGLWTAVSAFAIAALLPVPGASNTPAWLDNLAQIVCFLAFVASSYLIARMTYYVARIESHWPAIFTATSVAGMIVLYCATELRSTRAYPIEAGPTAASAWFAITVAVGLLPTHIAAIVGVMQIRDKDNLMVWLLAIYGAVGAVYPLLIVANHIGGGTRWQLSLLYPVVWLVLLISFGALSLAGVIGAYRTKHDDRVGVELAASAS
jgi:hypothetical protein